jgi:hypothetical protein
MKGKAERRLKGFETGQKKEEKSQQVRSKKK